MPAHKDRLIAFRVDSNTAGWFDDFLSDRRIKNASFGARQIFIMGMQTHRLIVGKDTKLSSDLELQTIVDQMTPEQKEQLLQLLVQKLGTDKVKHWKELASLK